MTAEDHRFTKSYGAKGIRYRKHQRQLIWPNESKKPSKRGFEKALQEDIEDIKKNFFGKYNSGIIQMLAYKQYIYSIWK